MKTLLAVLLVAVVSGRALAQVLGDGEVLRLVNADRKADAQLPANQIRVVRPPNYPGVTFVGYQLGTRNCILGTVIFNGALWPAQKAAGEVLRSKGWEKAGPDARLVLAREWVATVNQSFGETLVTEKPADWPVRGMKYFPVEERALPDGGVLLSTWIREDSGPSKDSSFRQTQYTFSNEGNLVRSRVMERFEAIAQ